MGLVKAEKILMGSDLVGSLGSRMGSDLAGSSGLWTNLETLMEELKARVKWKEMAFPMDLVLGYYL